MSKGAHAARKAFAQTLKELRLDAGLTGRDLATAIGMHNTKISRIEHARQNPSEDDIRAWAIACGAARQIIELIAIHREVEQMWIEHRKEMRKGQKHIQARVARQKLITQPTGLNRYAFVVEAPALTYVYGHADVMHEQLDLLLAATRLPHMSLGIIPFGAVRRIWSDECIYILDNVGYAVTCGPALFRTTRPDEIEFFLKVFEMLRDQAVFGDAAREQIETARAFLQTGENS